MHKKCPKKQQSCLHWIILKVSWSMNLSFMKMEKFFLQEYYDAEMLLNKMIRERLGEKNLI